MKYPTDLVDMTQGIVNSVRSSPREFSDKRLYNEVTERIAYYILSKPNCTDRGLPQGHMKNVLLVLFSADHPLTNVEIRDRIIYDGDKEPSEKSINSCLRKGEERLWIDRQRASGQTRAYKNQLTDIGRQFVMEKVFKSLNID